MSNLAPPAADPLMALLAMLGEQNSETKAQLRQMNDKINLLEIGMARLIDHTVAQGLMDRLGALEGRMNASDKDTSKRQSGAQQWMTTSAGFLGNLLSGLLAVLMMQMLEALKHAK